MKNPGMKKGHGHDKGRPQHWGPGPLEQLRESQHAKRTALAMRYRDRAGS